VPEIKNFEDGHSKGETPGLFPNPEAKPFVSMTLAPKRRELIELSSIIFSKIFYKIRNLIPLMKKLSKSEAAKQVEEFFSNIKDKTPKEVKKIKRLAANSNIRLREKRKLFCKKCLEPYKNPKVRINKGIKSVECGNCGYVARWKIN